MKSKVKSKVKSMLSKNDAAGNTTSRSSRASQKIVVATYSSDEVAPDETEEDDEKNMDEAAAGSLHPEDRRRSKRLEQVGAGTGNNTLQNRSTLNIRPDVDVILSLNKDYYKGIMEGVFQKLGEKKKGEAKGQENKAAMEVLGLFKNRKLGAKTRYFKNERYSKSLVEIDEHAAYKSKCTQTYMYRGPKFGHCHQTRTSLYLQYQDLTRILICLSVLAILNPCSPQHSRN